MMFSSMTAGEGRSARFGCAGIETGFDESTPNADFHLGQNHTTKIRGCDRNAAVRLAKGRAFPDADHSSKIRLRSR
jgi:hypothetical protein